MEQTPPSTSDVNQRLPSFKGPRDLSLSSARLQLGLSNRGRSKYTPNIPAKRDRNAEKKESNSPSQLPSTSSNRGGDRGRGFGRDDRGQRGGRRRQVEYVQAEGAIFADGIGEAKTSSKYRAPTAGGSRSGGSGSSTGGVVRKAVQNSTELMDTIKNKSLKSIIGNGKGFISDLEQADEDGFEKTIHLPLFSCFSRLNTNQQNEEEGLMIKPKKKRADKITFAQTYSSLPPEGTIVLLQLPENLPSFHHHPDDKDGSKKTLTQSISTLPEGLVASFELLSTGESRIVMGDAQFELVTGTWPGFLQELILDEEDEFTSLGTVQYKYVGIPNVDSILDSNVHSDL